MSDVIAVDLGGTNIRAARVDASGCILARDKVSTLAAEGMGAVVGRIADLIQRLKTPDTVAVGIGTPGVPDQITGEMRLPAVNLPGSANFPLTSTLATRVALPVVADNDGNLAALGESWLGAGKDEPVVLIFTLGTGIGGGCVVNGQVYHGHHNLGTEFGHLSIDWNGRKCGCSGIGCVELYSSASALGRDARDALRNGLSSDKTSTLSALEIEKSTLLKLCGGPAGIDKVDSHMVWEAVKTGDVLACFLADRCCRWLACAMGSLVNSFNPSCVIIGGGMALAGAPLTSRLHAELDKGRVFGPIWKDCKLRLAVLGDDAGLLGAARMAWQRQAGVRG